ncbi:MAG: signal peptide peptidase SppA [candidate division Zixibacteria bacterium]|nr:signal peptide peptidase SppA [candidate division Zixibacteria bacterium]
MKKFWTALLAVLGGLVVLAIVALLVVVAAFISEPGVPGTTILETDLECGLIEYVPDDPVARALTGHLLRVRDVVEALEKAADDDRVVGLIAHIGAGSMAPAEVQEVRDAVMAFRGKGKTAIAYSETFGELGPGNGAYYLATAFDEVYLQPSGDVGLTGIMFRSPFVKGTLDKLDIEPRMDHRYEYKNAMNTLTEKKFTEAHREATQKVMESIFNQMVAGIASGRGLSESEVSSLIDSGPFYGQEALDAGLVDGLAYRDEVYDIIRERGGEDAKLLYLRDYLQRAGRPHECGKTVALIYGAGDVVRGESGYDPLMQSLTMGSRSVTAAFRAAIEDDDVRAILFRINSPGGSYVASDAIWRETIRARQAGKPVIASMGHVAGSGGYFVAMAADKIVAQPATITGSIGVIGGKAVVTGFWEKLGLTWDEVHTSANSTIWSYTDDYTPRGWQRLQDWLDRVYEDFTAKVADGRGLPIDSVLKIAKGRIWSGEDARQLGLIDELGGFPTALRLAKEAAGIPPEEDVELRLYPEEKSLLDILLGDEPESSEDVVVAAATRMLGALQPAAQLMRQLGLVDDGGVLRMPEVATGD